MPSSAERPQGEARELGQGGQAVKAGWRILEGGSDSELFYGVAPVGIAVTPGGRTVVSGSTAEQSQSWWPFRVSCNMQGSMFLASSVVCLGG